MSSGILKTASRRSVAYCAYPPSVKMPITKSATSSHLTMKLQSLAVDRLLFTHYKVTLSALRAHQTVSTVPAAADTLSNLPHLFARWDGDNIPNNLVSWDTGEASGRGLVPNDIVTGSTKSAHGKTLQDGRDS